jgi:hypothetical protein
MEIVGTAFAQPLDGGLQQVSPYWFYVAGGVIAVVGLAFVWRNIAVTSGHAVIVALGVAIIALPSIADFEWTDGGFKFSTRQQVTQLAAQVEALNRQEEAINAALIDMGEAMQVMTERLVALDEETEGGRGTETAERGWAFDPAIYDRIITERRSAIQLNQQRLNEINELQRQIQIER